MRRKLAVALLLCPLLLLAQQTVKLDKWKDNSSIHERYEVLKADRKIRHGHYQQLLNDLVLEDGYYKNGQKDSLWQSFNNSGVLIAAGTYKNDEQAGTWNFYNDKGVLEQSYDFTEQKLLYFLPEKPGKEQKYTVLIDNEYKEVILERPPLFIGGTAVVGKALTYGVKIPHEAFESGRSGKVIIRLDINEKGEVGNYRIKESYGCGLDEEVLRVVKTFQHWIPGIYQGKEIASSLNIPFKLKMSKGSSPDGFPTNRMSKMGNW